MVITQFTIFHYAAFINTSRSALVPIIISICLACFCSVALANVDEQNRLEFRQAVKALQVGDYQKFKYLAERNRDYLLYPYLNYFDISARLNTIEEKEVKEFIKNYLDTPLSRKMQRTWLSALAKQKRWDEFIDEYQTSGSTKLRCQYLHAKISRTKHKKLRKRLISKAKKLWMTGKKLPKACVPLFKILYERKAITKSMIWERIEKVMKRGDLKFAKSLAKRLDKKKRKLLKAWSILYKDPTILPKSKTLKSNNKTHHKIALHVMRRYARRNAEKAHKLWPKVKGRYSFVRDQIGKMDRYIALRAAYQLHPEALPWLAKVKSKWVDNDVLIWRARAALRGQNWPTLISSIKKLEQYEQKDHRWQYWLARAKHETGRTGEAQKIFKSLSTFTNYYGFLAADQVNISYTFGQESLESDPRRLALLEMLPAMQRSRELFLIDRLSEARSEWNFALAKFDEPKVKLAAVMAYQWQWYDNAIQTIASTSHRADYGIRFPTPFKDLVEINAETHGIDMSWIYGITRRESAFKVDARSRVGASGLMQLMPGTARMQSKQLGLKRPTKKQLFNPNNNIKLGSAYLNQMLNKFNGNQVLATAAYNAGPNRVKKWIPKNTNMAIDVWVDTIPYKETREYVRAVMAYATIFDWRLESKIILLRDRMGKIVQ